MQFGLANVLLIDIFSFVIVLFTIITTTIPESNPIVMVKQKIWENEFNVFTIEGGNEYDTKKFYSFFNKTLMAPTRFSVKNKVRMRLMAKKMDPLSGSSYLRNLD